MAFTATSANHQSPYELTPVLSQNQINTGVWGSVANTCVITDSKIHANSDVQVKVTGTTPAVGRWSYTTAQGSLTITSSDAESSTLPMSYVVY